MAFMALVLNDSIQSMVPGAESRFIYKPLVHPAKIVLLSEIKICVKITLLRSGCPPHSDGALFFQWVMDLLKETQYLFNILFQFHFERRQ